MTDTSPFKSERGVVDHFRQMRISLADDDNFFGAHRVIPVAHQQLDRMHALHNTLRDRALRDFFHVRTEFADLLGWLHQDSGDYAAAQYWVGRSLDFAHMSGSSINVAFVLARRSQIAGEIGDVNGAVLSAEAALGVLGDTNRRISAIAATYLGYAYALQGDARLSGVSYERARQLLAEHDGDDEPWGRFFNQEYIDVSSAQSFAVLGQHREALATFDISIAALPASFRRDQAVYLAHQARVLAQSGDLDASAEIGANALRINAETGSARGLRELAALNRILQPFDNLAVREFRDMFTRTKTEV